MANSLSAQLRWAFAVFLLFALSCERAPDQMWSPNLKRAASDKHLAQQKPPPQILNQETGDRAAMDVQAELLEQVRLVGELWRTGNGDREKAREIVETLDVELLVPQLAEALNGDPQLAAGAARVAGILGDQSVVDALLEGIKSNDLFFAEACAWALGEMEAETAIPVMQELLESGRTPAVSAAIIKALGSMGDDQVIPAILEAGNDESSVVRLAVIEALVAIATRQEAPAEVSKAIGEAVGDPNPEVRVAAAKGLVSIGSSDAISGLVRLLQTPSESARQVAAAELVKHPNRSLVRRTLVDALEDGEGAARLYVVDALTRVCDSSCIDGLQSRANRTKNTYSRNAMQAVIRALGGD